MLCGFVSLILTIMLFQIKSWISVGPEKFPISPWNYRIYTNNTNHQLIQTQYHEYMATYFPITVQWVIITSMIVQIFIAIGVPLAQFGEICNEQFVEFYGYSTFSKNVIFGTAL